MTGDHRRIVEGADLDQAFLGDQPVDLALGLVLTGAVDAHLGAELADALDLDRRHQRRHANNHPNSQDPAGMGQTAAMIAGRHTNHARRLGAAGNWLGIGRAAQFEGAGRLQAFQFEPNFTAQPVTQRMGADQRGAGDGASDAPMGGENIRLADAAPGLTHRRSLRPGRRQLTA